MSRSPATDANRGTGQQQGQQQQGQQQGGQKGSGGGQQSKDKQGGANDDDGGDDADEDEGDGGESDSDESDSDESGKETLEDVKAKLKKSEKERRRLKRRLREATGGGQSSDRQQGQQQQGQQQGQQGAGDQSQAEVQRLRQELVERDARDSFYDAVLNDSDKNKFRVKSRNHAKRAWRALKDDAEIDPKTGDIENLDELLETLRDDMPEFLMKRGGKNGKVITSGDGGSGSRGRQSAGTDMNAGIRDMFARKQGRS